MSDFSEPNICITVKGQLGALFKQLFLDGTAQHNTITERKNSIYTLVLEK